MKYYYKCACQFSANSMMSTIKSYLGPEPILIANNPYNPTMIIKDWFCFKTVREYFAGMRDAVRIFAEEFNAFYSKTMKAFERLSDKR